VIRAIIQPARLRERVQLAQLQVAFAVAAYHREITLPLVAAPAAPHRAMGPARAASAKEGLPDTVAVHATPKAQKS
jgi:hypothetical protein